MEAYKGIHRTATWKMISTFDPLRDLGWGEETKLGLISPLLFDVSCHLTVEHHRHLLLIISWEIESAARKHFCGYFELRKTGRSYKLLLLAESWSLCQASLSTQGSDFVSLKTHYLF